ncbi:hypothetical protein T484DRAFT_1940771 [Baffinella frigidus]|nr:hypothetical protein T484DRAFT_1940771 [Cryptophyta sp. CCMP2293]|eukprot:CAMPEP_0180294094 /NCGR_PEP_ID=MMETSP0988-20121125/17974_1 /TAXON_ID=697907 /ORGANISM="non described non described, Strain CCMP2293" /LENGTH=196 /DNA_ID=CAMNT_0022270967 /DNA_START=384 /DNA_END=974 /DNA_ORIENTATION=-
MQAYAAAMKHSPLLTKAASASVLFGLGDVFAQQQLRPAPFDARRAGSFAAFAALVYAPVQHMWFGWMEAHVAAGRTWAARPMLQAAARVAAHSVVFAPCSIAALFAWTAVARGSPLTVACAPERVAPVWAAGSVFWIPTMLGIYRFVPLASRVLVTSACNVGWSSYLSSCAAAPPSEPGPVAKVHVVARRSQELAN